MSTFSGIVDEFPLVSVDRFDGNNLSSKIFFLSHCHVDHMCGLENPEGLPGPLYLSSISAVIIRKQFAQIKSLVVLANNCKSCYQMKISLCSVDRFAKFFN